MTPGSATWCELPMTVRPVAWWATKNEWLGLIDVAGLDVEALYGGFDGEPWTQDSTEYVFVARRGGGDG